jgi:hypothetical protein
MNKAPNVILIYAYRYGMGRNTGAVVDAIECIKENIGNFKKWEINSMIDEYVQFSKLFGVDKDIPNKRDLDDFMLYLNEVLIIQSDLEKIFIKED